MEIVTAALGRRPVAAARPVVLIVVLIVATVFNDLMALLPVGEMANDGFIYVLPLAMLYFLR